MRQNSKTYHWWNNGWHFPLPLKVDPPGYERCDKPVEVELNFKHIFNTLGKRRTLNKNSLGVVDRKKIWRSSG